MRKRLSFSISIEGDTLNSTFQIYFYVSKLGLFIGRILLTISNEIVERDKKNFFPRDFWETPVRIVRDSLILIVQDCLDFFREMTIIYRKLF